MKRNLNLITIAMLAVSLAFAGCGEKNGGNGGIAGFLALLTGNNAVSPGSKTLVSFSIVSPASTGVIDETAKTVSVTVPYGTTVTALVANFTTTGASVKVGTTTQVSGVSSNDFTSPVTYTVTAADGSTQDYTVTVLFAPAVNSVHNMIGGGVLSTYWTTSTNTILDIDSLGLTLECDAINAGSDTFTVVINVGHGNLTPHAPGSVWGPYLTVPSDTTVTSPTDQYLEIVGSLTSIQSVIHQVKYLPPAYAVEDEFLLMDVIDKNGLKARGRIYINVFVAE